MTEGVVEVCQSSQTTSGSENRDQPCASHPANGRPTSSSSPPSCSSSNQRNATLYSSVTTSVLSEFVPSRPTRQSTNKALQNEVSDVRIAMLQQRGLAAKNKANWLSISSRTPAAESEALVGQYADLDFMAPAVKQEGSRREAQELNGARRDQLMSVYGLERSAVYENLVRPRDGMQASFWVGADHKGIPSDPASSQCSASPEPCSSSRSESPHGVDSTGSNAAVEELIPAAPRAQYGLAGRSVSCDSTVSVRSSECDDDVGSDRHAGGAIVRTSSESLSSATTATSPRSQTLNFPRRMSSRRRCVTPVLVTRAAPPGNDEYRRHYEETDLVTGLPFDTASTSPSLSPRPGSPQTVDSGALQDLSYVHARSSSAPEGVSSALADDSTPAHHPVSPLAQDQIFGTGSHVVTKVMYHAGPPRPPLRRSSLSVKSQSSEALPQATTSSSSSSSQRRVQLCSPDGTPPLPPKNRRRQDSSSTLAAAAAAAAATQDQSDDTHVTTGAGDGAMQGGQSPNLSLAGDYCGSPSSVVDSSLCSSPELLTVGTLPCRKSWRKSTALEVFGEFQLVFLGRLDVDVAYGAVNGVMEDVVQASAAGCTGGSSPTPCSLIVTASSLQVSTSDGILFGHEVDSVETIAVYSGKCLPSAEDSGREDYQNVFSYVMVQEGVAATCFVFRAGNDIGGGAVVSTIETALYADVKRFKSMTYPRHVVMRNNVVGRAGQFSIKHIGSIAVQSAYNSIDEAGRQILAHTNPAKVHFSFMDLDADRIRLRKTTSNVIYASHQSHAVTSVGSFSEDRRVFGYVVRQRSSALLHMCHIYRCCRPATALAIIECIKDICQESYMSRLKSKEDKDSSDEDRSSSSATGRGIRSFFSRALKTPSRSQAECRSSEKLKSASVPEAEAPVDVPRLRPESTVNMIIIELTESPTLRRLGSTADDPALNSDTGLDFCIDYIGTGSLLYNEHRPKDMTKQVLQDFARSGKDAGAVESGRVKVSVRVSSQGVTLTDTDHVMFVKRHYPRRTLFHVDQHEVDRELFSFATLPPSISSVRHSPVNRTAVKVHVFRCTEVPVGSVTAALRGIMHRFPA